MFQPEPALIDTLKALNSSYRFVHYGPTFTMVEGKPAQDKPGGCRCEIIDNTTQKVYCVYPAAGTDEPRCDEEPEALKGAVKKAITAEKPLTQAQQAEKRFRETGSVLIEKNKQQAATIESLTAELQALQAKVATMGAPDEDAELAESYKGGGEPERPSRRSRA